MLILVLKIVFRIFEYASDRFSHSYISCFGLASVIFYTLLIQARLLSFAAQA